MSNCRTETTCIWHVGEGNMSSWKGAESLNIIHQAISPVIPSRLVTARLRLGHPRLGKENFPYGWVLGWPGEWVVAVGFTGHGSRLSTDPLMGFYTHTFHIWYIHLPMIYYVKCWFLIPFETYDIVKMGQNLLTLGVQIQQEMTPTCIPVQPQPQDPGSILAQAHKFGFHLQKLVGTTRYGMGPWRGHGIHEYWWPFGGPHLKKACVNNYIRKITQELHNSSIRLILTH